MKPVTIDVLTMGVQPAKQNHLIRDLERMTGLSVRCNAYNVFRITPLIQAVIRLLLSRADIIILHWDIEARPSRLLLAINFRLFGMLGLQYLLFSRARVPTILLSPNETDYFLHADIAAYAKTLGRNAFLAESVDEVKKRIETLLSPPVWGGKKVCIFGKPFKSSTVRSPALSHAYLAQRTGVDITYRPVKELLKMIRRISDHDAEAEMESWITPARHVSDAARREVLASSKLYLALNALIEKNAYDGVSIACISRDFPENPIMPHPCLAFSRLRDKGVAAVCEADVCALLSAMFMESIAQKPSYMGNVVHVDTLASTVTITHCISALKMRGYDTEPLPYSLHDYHGTGKGVVPSVEFTTGEAVTLGLVSKDLTSFAVWPGTLVESGDDFCANMAKVRVQDAKGFKHSILGCHYVMVYGDIAEHMHEALLDLNIRPVMPFPKEMPLPVAAESGPHHHHSKAQSHIH